MNEAQAAVPAHLSELVERSLQWPDFAASGSLIVGWDEGGLNITKIPALGRERNVATFPRDADGLRELWQTLAQDYPQLASAVDARARRAIGLDLVAPRAALDSMPRERSGTAFYLLDIALPLLGLALLGGFIWIVYGFASGSFSVFGNCGPQAFIGKAGRWVGGSASSAWAAAALGGLLWAAAGAAVWRLKRTGSVWWLETSSAVAFAYIAIYIAALIVLAIGLAPSIWGLRQCRLY